MIRRRFFPRIFIVACTLASLFYLAFVQEGAGRSSSSSSSSVFSSWSETGDEGETPGSLAGRIANPRKRNGNIPGQKPLLHEVDDLTDSSYRPPGSAYPYTWTLVLSTVTFTDIRWLSTSLTDLVPPRGNLQIANYVNNDPSAPLHAPIAKGNEALGYLTYILDNYDDDDDDDDSFPSPAGGGRRGRRGLPDISIFMHGAATAWHNNDLLNFSSPTLLHRLNLDRVVREGYVNLRCQWQPGCPAHIHPFAEDFDEKKQEESLFLTVWPELFPDVRREAVPRVLAQPCCAQFALSRAAIRAVPRDTYVHLRDWIVATTLGSQLIGQVFEYVWQYLFLGGREVHCPDPRVCYCETYGVCLLEDGGKGGGEGYNEFFRLRREGSCWRRKMEGWDGKLIDDDGEGKRRPPEDPRSREHGGWLEEQWKGTQSRAEEMMREAWKVGMDSRRRAEVVRAAQRDTDFVPDDESDCQEYEL